MTVCVGAVCSGVDGVPAKAVVIAADRMVTMGGFQEFEHEVPKITEVVTGKIVTLIAGDARRGARLSQHLKSEFQNSAQSVERVAQVAAEKYVEMRLQQIEVEAFKPRGITSRLPMQR